MNSESLTSTKLTFPINSVARENRPQESLPFDRRLAPTRVLFALPGLHRVNRGAEVAFESIAQELGRVPGFEVTLIGSGEAREGTSYQFRHANALPREGFRKFPTGPLFRHECMYEELSFVPGLWGAYSPHEIDITVTCSYPYVNWLLRARRSGARRPLHVYVTQNGDWPIRARGREYRFFGCDGLICTSPDYYGDHRHRWPSVLIPNGVDTESFAPGTDHRRRFGLPCGQPIALMVSALIPSKRVLAGIQSVAKVPGLFLALVGEGPLENEADCLGARLLGDRYRRLTLKREDMPALYRSCDVFLHMSQIEAFGIVYVEALASGLPIVTHDRALTRWILDGHATFVDTGIESEVANGLCEALQKKSDQCAMRQHQLAADRFSWTSIARQYGMFFRDLLGENHNIGDKTEC